MWECPENNGHFAACLHLCPACIKEKVHTEDLLTGQLVGNTLQISSDMGSSFSVLNDTDQKVWISSGVNWTVLLATVGSIAVLATAGTLGLAAVGAGAVLLGEGVQWNPSITATVGEWHFGPYSEVAFRQGSYLFLPLACSSQIFD